VKQTKRSYDGSRNQRTKYVIQNGVKETIETILYRTASFMTTIKNGVKYTQHEHKPLQPLVNDAIKHGEKIELK
jgi:hypothetical protein